MTASQPQPLIEQPHRRKWLANVRRCLATMGPGLMVCFADTDGPCLITAAQSGAQWSYDLLSVQIVLIPILFFAQELTVRLGLVRGMGIIGILKKDVGRIWAWLVAVPLLISCVFGLFSEFSMIGQTMLFWGVPVWATNIAVTLVLSSLALSGSYSVAEKVGLCMGACQVILFVTMFMAKPDGGEILDGLATFPLGDPSFVKLVTANIGAVIMPWMLAYQQSAICDKGLTDEGEGHMLLNRIDTLVGSFLTQGVMAAMLITVAAAVKPGQAVNEVNDLLNIFSDVLGSEIRAKWLLTFAIVGACMVAAIVQTLCAAWVFEEALGQHRGASASLGEAAHAGEEGWSVLKNIRQRPLFYGCYIGVCIAACIFTLLTDNAVNLSVTTEFLNGILMPPVVFALWYLSAYSLPEKHRLGAFYKWFLFIVFFICSLFCLGSIYTAFLPSASSAAPAFAVTA